MGDWLLHLGPGDRERLARAGASLQETPLHTRVSWPDGLLRRFLLEEVLIHELGHHFGQFRRRSKRPVCRRKDHERLADHWC